LVSVYEAVERDLQAMGDLKNSGLAATALALAAEMDGNNSATSKSNCAKALMEALAALRALAPPDRKADGIDDIAEQRRKRRAAVAGGAAT
jgi:hypothetical protein